jgi:hypothetical protein
MVRREIIELLGGDGVMRYFSFEVIGQLETQYSKLNTQYSKLETRNSKLETRNAYRVTGDG